MICGEDECTLESWHDESVVRHAESEEQMVERGWGPVVILLVSLALIASGCGFLGWQSAFWVRQHNAHHQFLDHVIQQQMQQSQTQRPSDK